MTMMYDRTPQARLLDLFNDGHELSIQDIMVRVGIGSDRHVRRIIRSIEHDGIPLQVRWVGRIKKFHIAEGDRRLPVHLVPMAEEQIFSLIVAAQASRAVLAPTPLGMPLEQAFDALLGTMSAHIYSFDSDAAAEHWLFGSPSAVDIDPTIFSRLARAIQECRRVRIDYLTASTGIRSHDRLIEPYGMAVRNGSWLVIAYCRQKQAIRDFSLAGISRAEFCLPDRDLEFFVRPDDFDLRDYFQPRFSALAGDTIYTVRMLVEPDRAAYFQRKTYHPTQVIEDVREDGRIVVAYTVSGLEEIRTFAQGWGVGVTVLEPDILVQRLRDEAGVLAARYHNGTGRVP